MTPRPIPCKTSLRAEDEKPRNAFSITLMPFLDERARNLRCSFIRSLPLLELQVKYFPFTCVQLSRYNLVIIELVRATTSHRGLSLRVRHMQVELTLQVETTCIRTREVGKRDIALLYQQHPCMRAYHSGYKVLVWKGSKDREKMFSAWQVVL